MVLSSTSGIANQAVNRSVLSGFFHENLSNTTSNDRMLARERQVSVNSRVFHHPFLLAIDSANREQDNVGSNLARFFAAKGPRCGLPPVAPWHFHALQERGDDREPTERSAHAVLLRGFTMFQFLAITQAGSSRSFPRDGLCSITAPAVSAVVALVALVICPQPVNADQGSRPNIVLIMADDLGFSDLGCYGSEIETPNLDQLASQGLRFNQFYNTAKCHSSRICLLTGLYMFQAGNKQMDRGVTLAEAVKPAGYHTMMVGKWHLEGQPTERGFDRYFGHLSGATNFFTGDNTFRLNGEAFEVPKSGFYTTDAKTDYALEFLDEAKSKDQPFLLYVAYNAPHYPLQVKESDFRKYEGRYDAGWDKIRKQRYQKQQQLGILPEGTELSPRPDEVAAWDSLSQEQRTWESERMAAYAGMIDCLDQNIGRLVDHLDKLDLADDTIVMFCSDNGACPFERTRGREFRPWDPKSYWTYDVGWAHVGNTPFRWYKQNQHEGGISSPLIVSWPGLKAKAGSVTDQPAHLIDFMATCVDLADAEYPQSYAGRKITPVQGRSLTPVFSGLVRDPHPWIYFQFSNNRAVRKGDLKVVSVKGRPWELYDLGQDRSELNNLAKSRPDDLKRMRELWFEIAEQTEQAPAQMRRPLGQGNPQKKGSSNGNRKPKTQGK